MLTLHFSPHGTFVVPADRMEDFNNVLNILLEDPWLLSYGQAMVSETVEVYYFDAPAAIIAAILTEWYPPIPEWGIGHSISPADGLGNFIRHTSPERVEEIEAAHYR